MDDYGMPEVGKIEYNGPGFEPSPMGVVSAVAAVGFAIYAGVVWSAIAVVNYLAAVNVGAGINGFAAVNSAVIKN